MVTTSSFATVRKSRAQRGRRGQHQSHLSCLYPYINRVSLPFSENPAWQTSHRQSVGRASPSPRGGQVCSWLACALFGPISVHGRGPQGNETPTNRKHCLSEEKARKTLPGLNHTFQMDAWNISLPTGTQCSSQRGGEWSRKTEVKIARLEPNDSQVVFM